MIPVRLIDVIDDIRILHVLILTLNRLAWRGSYSVNNKYAHGARHAFHVIHRYPLLKQY